MIYADSIPTSGSVAAIFVVFLAGVLTSFTPCVYPMIPVTVTFIGTASSGSRRRAVSLSVVYALGLSLLYATLGILAAVLGQTFGNISRNIWVNAGVALVLGLFAAAMMGWINIPVPGFAGKMQTSGVRKGGHFGAFAIGIAAGFVAAPCTAPVLGFLLAWVAQMSRTAGGALSWKVAWGGLLLFVFALGLSFLLVLLGIFSGLIANMPRAGRWMNTIKYVFGIGMFAVAAFFLWKAISLALQ